MAMKFYSDIELTHQKTAPQFGDVNHTEFENIRLSHMYPLAGGIPYSNCVAFDSVNKTFDLNKATGIGRYYCNTNGQINTLKCGDDTFLSGNCIFELIVNERIGTFIKENKEQHSYYIQTLRVHTNIISVDNVSGIDDCLVEYRRHFDMVTTEDQITRLTFGNWNICWTPVIVNKKVALPNLCLNSLNNGGTEVGAAIGTLSTSINNAGIAGTGWVTLYLKTLYEGRNEVGSTIQEMLKTPRAPFSDAGSFNNTNTSVTLEVPYHNSVSYSLSEPYIFYLNIILQNPSDKTFTAFGGFVSFIFYSSYTITQNIILNTVLDASAPSMIINPSDQNLKLQVKCIRQTNPRILQFTISLISTSIGSLNNYEWLANIKSISV